MFLQYLCEPTKESAAVGQNWGKQGDWMKQIRGIFLGSAAILWITRVLVKQREAVSKQKEPRREILLFVATWF
jgi:hypothetical protein